mmetsp:Transcript_8872/g.36279  ORF Transcript_8872/g.36279 Transcript_8872/m.36279 type:complete len:253 (+) Transcript_8872:422-1180(+)
MAASSASTPTPGVDIALLTDERLERVDLAAEDMTDLAAEDLAAASTTASTSARLASSHSATFSGVLDLPTSSRTFSISTAASTSSAASAARAASMAKASSKSKSSSSSSVALAARAPASAAASAYSAAAAASAAATNSSAPSISSSMVQFTASMAVSSSLARMRATALCLACPPGVCAMFAAHPSRLRSAATAGFLWPVAGVLAGAAGRPMVPGVAIGMAPCELRRERLDLADDLHAESLPKSTGEPNLPAE